MYTHKMKLVTDYTTFEADVQFLGDDEPSWKTTDDVELTMEEMLMLQRILTNAGRIYKKRGLVKLMIKED